MKKKRSWHIALSLLLIGLLLAELLPITGIAQNDSENEVIVSFDMPITEIIVPLGTEKEDIPLPKNLAATLEEGTVVDIPVIWEDSGVYNKEAAGTYLFTADIGTWIYAQARPIAVVTVAPPGIHISGKLWLDKNDDGIRDADETGIAGYPVTLYAEDDLNTPVQTTFTKVDGGYWFEGMEPGSYVVRVTSETIGETEYLLPQNITNDNKFAMDEDAAASWSVPLEIVEDEAVTGIDAGMRLPVGIMPLVEWPVSNFQRLKDCLENDAQSGDTIVLTNSFEFDEALVIKKNLTLTFETSEDDAVVLTCKNSRHFIIKTGINAEFTFKNVELNGGEKGGGIEASMESKVVLNGAIITKCYTDSNGGGVYINNSLSGSSVGNTSLSLYNCEISYNTAVVMGGGVCASMSKLKIVNCNIHDNLAENMGGGGVEFNGGFDFSVSDSEICNNKSGYMGGGILAGLGVNGIGNISNSRISENESRTGGGALFSTSQDGVVTIDHSEIHENVASDTGGGISCGFTESSAGKVVIENGSEIWGNIAEDGGGIYANSLSPVTVKGSSITSNHANNDGGGIYTGNLDELSVSEDVTFNGNDASMDAQPLQYLKDRYPNIRTDSHSVYDHPLNNYDINVLIVTVHYIDGAGNDLLINESTSVRYAVDLNDPFPFPDNEIPIPLVPGLGCTGWISGSKDGQKTPLPIKVPKVTNDMDIYLVYENRIVTVSNVVSDDYADKTKDFLFTVYFKEGDDPLEAGALLQYIRETEGEAPLNGTLTLEAGGKATFTLKHGQQISIFSVPQDTVRVEESVDSQNYQVSIAGDVEKEDSDTGDVNLSEGDKTFAFTNKRISVVPAGVLIGNLHGPALLVLSMLLLMGIASFGMIHSRRKRGL
nr:SdrD B-like domain-containing protein [uncultured Clostridium sp.]